jgi:hypothetical protein
MCFARLDFRVNLAFVLSLKFVARILTVDEISHCHVGRLGLPFPANLLLSGCHTVVFDFVETGASIYLVWIVMRGTLFEAFQLAESIDWALSLVRRPVQPSSGHHEVWLLVKRTASWLLATCCASLLMYSLVRVWSALAFHLSRLLVTRRRVHIGPSCCDRWICTVQKHDLARKQVAWWWALVDR